MKKQPLLAVIIIAFLHLINFQMKAQVIVNYVFTQDSLAGFDEESAKAAALSKNLFDKEFKYYMYKSKREYIDHKYHLGTHQHDGVVWRTAKTTTATIQPGCSNVDFEDGTFNGWSIAWGTNGNSTTMAGCCPNLSGTISQVINSVGTDPWVGAVLPLTSPFGGNKIAKINDDNSGAVVERISQTFSVTPGNAIFQFAYAGVLEDASHDCTNQPFINVSVLDSSGTILTCPKIDIVAPSPLCTQPASTTAGWTASGSGVFYHDWEVRTIDLSPYIGTSVTIQITVGDCAAGAHFGYGYFDCKCSPLEINLNTSVYDATSQVPINVSTCGASSALITAPTGLNPYLWNGPAGSGVSAITTQTISSVTPGTYTLVMSPTGTCYGPITKHVILNVTPNPTVTNVTAQATCTNATGSGTVNVSSGTFPFTYNWSPAASTNSIATGLMPGIDYTVNIVDTYGCQNSTTVSITSFSNAPTYTINPLSANLSCSTPSLMISTITGTNTTAAWTHTASTNFVTMSAGTYSCVLTNTVSLCTATVPVTIGSNTVTPAATHTVNCNAANLVALNAASTSGVALGWLVPTAPPSPVSNPGTTSASGIFTLTATNLSSGCKTTYTVESALPTLNVVSTPSTNILTCTNQTVQAMATASPTNATITWINGATTTTTSAFQFPGQGTYTAVATSTAGCKTQSIITVSTNTTAVVSITSPSGIIPCSTNNLGLTATGIGGVGPYTFVWLPSSPTATGSVYNVSDAGSYTVVALNTANGCTATAVRAVTQETISASFIADPTMGLMPLAVSFTNTSVNGVNYAWSLGNSSSTYTTTDVSTTYNFQGIYTAQLIVTNGLCVDTAYQLIKVDLLSFLTVPNVFTPNGDNVNDVFNVEATNIGEISINVFDRWGLKIYSASSSGTIKWDGKTKSGQEVSDGTYFYLIKAKGLDDKDYDLQGTINVFK